MQSPSASGFLIHSLIPSFSMSLLHTQACFPIYSPQMFPYSAERCKTVCVCVGGGLLYLAQLAKTNSVDRGFPVWEWSGKKCPQLSEGSTRPLPLELMVCTQNKNWSVGTAIFCWCHHYHCPSFGIWGSILGEGDIPLSYSMLIVVTWDQLRQLRIIVTEGNQLKKSSCKAQLFNLWNQHWILHLTIT